MSVIVLRNKLTETDFNSGCITNVMPDVAIVPSYNPLEGCRNTSRVIHSRHSASIITEALSGGDAPTSRLFLFLLGTPKSRFHAILVNRLNQHTDIMAKYLAKHLIDLGDRRQWYANH